MMRADPITAVTIADVNVRFYEPPGDRPDLPWHSLVDIFAAARLSRSTRDELVEKARSYSDVGLVTLPDGTVIQSHAMATALISAMIEAGAVPPSFADDYQNAGASALEAMHADLPPEERFERMKVLARETLGVKLVLPA